MACCAAHKHKGNTQNQLEFELEGLMRCVLIRHSNALRF
ncbi:hypothetical protein BPUTSESOX_2341 [uncultured Gammaproteobacteria bacterium]|nr:hypothetical protein [uncultured Gammaproteobacteria bacterium]VVH50501.1 hypothetical protein BPUTSESOX_2341 [uncultured Gammaproteobacteria bacterium]